MRRPSARTVWTCLGLYALAAALTSAASWASRPVLTAARLDADEQEYLDISVQLSEGRYGYASRRTVGFPATLAAIRAVVGDGLRPLQQGVTLIWALTAPLAYLLARRELGHERAAIAAGLGVAAWPPFVRYGGTLYSETLAMPLLVAQLLAQPNRREPAARAWRWLLAGALLGLCIHARTMYQLFAPIAAARALADAPGWRRGFANAALLAAGTLAVVLPWSAAQTARHGTFILMTRNGGETLAGGLNPTLLAPRSDFVAPDGRRTWVGPGKWVPPERTGYLAPEESRLPYERQDPILAERAARWIRTHPSGAAYITICKLGYMWGIYPFWNGLSQTLAGNVPTLALLALAGASMARLRRHLGALAIYWTLPVYVSLVAAISWGSWRFRQPGDLGLIALAAALPWASRVARHLAGDEPPG